MWVVARSIALRVSSLFVEPFGLIAEPFEHVGEDGVLVSATTCPDDFHAAFAAQAVEELVEGAGLVEDECEARHELCGLGELLLTLDLGVGAVEFPRHGVHRGWQVSSVLSHNRRILRD